MSEDSWGFSSSSSSKNSIKSAPSPKVQRDYSPNDESTPTLSKQPERQKTIKTNASLVDKLGAFQMAMGYKNRTEAFEHVFKVGADKLLATKNNAKKRYKEAYNLIHK